MALSDRDYMRPASPSGGAWAWLRRVPPAKLLVGLLVAIHLAFIVAQSAGYGDWIHRHLLLSGGALKSGYAWTLVTNAFLHGGFLHLICNALGLWFLGAGVAEEHGAKRFWQVFLGGALAGALVSSLLWTLPAGLVAADRVLAYRDEVASLGASGGVLALVAYFLADKLNRTLRMLLYFVIPVTLEAKWLLVVSAGLSLLGLVFTEIPLATGWWHIGIHDTSVSHSAHLGGLALGYFWRRREIRRTLAGYAARRGLRVVSPARPTPAAGPALDAEVDRILDKINAHGLGSLTDAERATLDHARTRLRR